MLWLKCRDKLCQSLEGNYTGISYQEMCLISSSPYLVSHIDSLTVTVIHVKLSHESLESLIGMAVSCIFSFFE